ncbi:Delta-aminolevulinic acid dehydratase [Candidatus Methanoperedenaceae archaeon GB37]|nr:Delta-aminolevulinic acid dehydratase [Candidatus Methanoperedenaceae archaeon GB37]
MPLNMPRPFMAHLGRQPNLHLNLVIEEVTKWIPPNAREALREAELDVGEGADIIMVKPALPYLDIIYRVRQAINRPIAAYNVSGEFSMLKAAIANGWLEEKRVVLEALTSIKRAGADLILTYFAKEIATWLSE